MPGIRDLHEVRPELGELGDGLGAEQADREAAVQRERADRHREGGQPDDGDEEAVDRPGDGADEDGDDQPATSIGIPPWCRTPTSTLERPTMLATDRSISPVMMMSVIGSAISRIGAMSSSR